MDYFDMFPEPELDIEEEMYRDEYHEMPEPFAVFSEIVFIEGYLYRVTTVVWDEDNADMSHHQLEYTCWDGKLPF